jgi:hypothetical protein
MEESQHHHGGAMTDTLTSKLLSQVLAQFVNFMEEQFGVGSATGARGAGAASGGSSVLPVDEEEPVLTVTTTESADAGDQHQETMRVPMVKLPIRLFRDFRVESLQLTYSFRQCPWQILVRSSPELRVDKKTVRMLKVLFS